MAIRIKPFHKGLKHILEGDVDFLDDDIDAMLVSNGWTPDYLNDEFVDEGGANEPIDEEINAGNGDTNGYEAGYGGTGRQTLGSKTVTATTAGTVIDAGDLTFPGLEAALEDIHYVLIFKRGSANDTTAILLFCIELDPVFDPDGNDLKVQFNSSGIVRLRLAD